MATASNSTVPLAPFQYYNSERVPSRTIGLHLEISRCEHRADPEREAKPEPDDASHVTLVLLFVTIVTVTASSDVAVAVNGASSSHLLLESSPKPIHREKFSLANAIIDCQKVTHTRCAQGWFGNQEREDLDELEDKEAKTTTRGAACTECFDRRNSQAAYKCMVRIVLSQTILGLNVEMS